MPSSGKLAPRRLDRAARAVRLAVHGCAEKGRALGERVRAARISPVQRKQDLVCSAA